jgi:uncharacterized protein (DUF608 family)
VGRSGPETAPMSRLFPNALPSLEWLEFAARGFDAAACGIVHRPDQPAACGMPLGGISTGTLDLETDGTLGFCTIFNSHVPRRGPLNVPFLGLAVGREPATSQTWVLATHLLKSYTAALIGARGVQHAAAASGIDYWGHYPVADLEFELSAPVQVGLRAWSPFIPGNSVDSNVPAAVFEVHLRNGSAVPQEGTIAFSFPGPSPQEASGAFAHEAGRERWSDDASWSGVYVSASSDVAYALGALDVADARTGGDLGVDGGSWSTFGSQLPLATSQPGSSVAVDFAIPPSGEQVVRFLLAWYAPFWQGGGTPTAGGNRYQHMYATRYADVRAVVQDVAQRHPDLLRRILRWQATIYRADLPVWLREALVNSLHLIAEDSFWAAKAPPIGDWCRAEDGLFGMNECPRGCPQIECIPCSFYGNLPLVYFFPDLALSTARAYRAYQFADGAVPWIFGGCTGDPPTGGCEVALPNRGYARKPQTPLDGSCYVDLIDRLWQRTGNHALLDEFYDSIKRSTIFTMNLRPEAGPAGVVSMPNGNNAQDWMESCDLFGIVPHIGGVHLGHLQIAERMARAMGDAEFAAQCEAWLAGGRRELEEHAWNGDAYLLYHEPETGQRSDVIMSCQLDGEWMTQFHGVPGAFRPEHVQVTLATLRETCLFEHGAIVFKLREAGQFNPGYWSEAGVHVPSSLMLAMTYLYAGEREVGLDLAHRTWRTQALDLRASWDSALLFRGDTGEWLWGNDYYQNLMLWALPAAIAGQELAAASGPGSLVEQVIEAGKS